MENRAKKIFLLEDDQDLQQLLEQWLQSCGYEITSFRTCLETRAGLEKEQPDLLLADWNLPDGSGAEFIRQLRQRNTALPVLLLTVRNASEEVVFGLENGADDYVTKPFDPAVLLSRIRALLRRTQPASSSILECAGLRMDTQARRVWQDQEELVLSRPEYSVLQLFMENPGRTLLRRQIVEAVWEKQDQYVSDNTLSMTVRRLRQKLRHPESLKTICSYGYRLEDEV